MKKTLIYALLVFTACTSNPKGDSAETTDKKESAEKKGSEYKVDTSSLIRWAASKPTATHSGIIKIQSGNLFVDGNSVTGGSFTIDVTSLKNVDLSNDPTQQGKLEGHLKSPDFFDVTKFPTARFVITSIEPYQADSSQGVIKNSTHLVKGNLSLKDSTKNISFPARITVDEKTLSASADFNIDRTLWGINYKGPGNPENWFISKEINLKLMISGSKN